MPLLGEGSQQINTPSGYQFSAVPMEDLGASDYTLVTIVNDVSGSVHSFKDEMEDCLKTILVACINSPRSENLLVRLVQFDDAVQEIHGFRLLNSIAADEYDNVLNIGGSTALFDATHTCIDALATYGEQLNKKDFTVNGIAFIITDGDDNASSHTPAEIGSLLVDIRRKEHLESLRTVLIGVNAGYSGLQKYLEDFQKDAGLDQFEIIDNATPSQLAKLADFVSRSISSQSKSLGSGGPSQALSF